MAGAHPAEPTTGSSISPRLAGGAGILFILVGVVELALAGGPIPIPTAPTGEVSAYLESARGAAEATAALSGLAGAALLVFATGLRHAIPDPALGQLAWAAAVAMVAVAWTGQAVHQTAFRVEGGEAATLGWLVGFLFLFAVASGGLMAAAAGLASLYRGTPPRWLGVLGLALLVAALTLLAFPHLGYLAFPSFLVWLAAASGWMLRLG